MAERSSVRTGCDLQPVADVAEAVRDFGRRYLDRVYTPTEQQSLRAGGAASLAARFAAKEAVMKLLGTADGLDLRSVEVTVGDGGRPGVRLHGDALALAARERVGAIDLSLSHAGDLALAVAVATVEAPPQTTGQTETTTKGPHR